ncbi:MAG TPA: toxin-antitoxin (TA) system antitoxin [Chloroflexia bacterium]|nr:toxin-antitoxin (TA) system antitoxin [Chloroflexia bacterium]
MTITTVDVRDPQTQLPRLLALVAEGTEVILTDGAKTLARIVPMNGEQERPQRIAGLHPGAIWTSEDFDEPLPDEFWLGEA